MHQVEPPTQLGRYRIIAPLGTGGMGVVYRAWDPGLRRQVAIKVIRTDGRKRSKARRLSARLAREAQALARLSHPNVVPVFDVGVHGGAIFLTMAFVDGLTLRQWLGVRHRTLDEITAVFVAAGQGLAAAHAAGIIHRDFKPGNVLVTATGRVYVADFGLAHTERGEDTLVDDGDPSPPDESARALVLQTLSDDHGALGTLPYMAPEQHMAQPLDERADQYGFCVALYEALCGTRPFLGTSSQILLSAKLGHRVPVLARGAHVPRWLHRIVMRGLSPRTDDRFPSMLALVAAVQAGARRWPLGWT